MTYLDNLGEAETPDGRKLSLYHRHGDFYIDLDNEQLMSTRDHGSEDALARLACEDLATPDSPRVLIGGLGLGFTLRAALAILPPRAEIVVAEIMPAVVEWNRTHLKDISGPSMADPRVTIEVKDVQKLIGQGLPQYDAIMLDVDNGPDGWCIKSNGRIYDRGGLNDIRDTLKPGGCLAVWSAAPDSSFVKRMHQSGLDGRETTVRSRGHKGPHFTIFLARKPLKPSTRPRTRKKPPAPRRRR
jgi:spermidine synthase